MGRANRSPFTLSELEVVRDEFVAIVRGFVATATRRVAAEDVTRGLLWTRGHPQIDDLVSVPNEYVGRFSHADEQAVQVLVDRTFNEIPRLHDEPRSAHPTTTKAPPPTKA